MGNKLAVNSGSQNLRPTTGKSSLVQNTQQKHRGSSESLSTFFSLDSHADQCLLPKERHTAVVDSTPLDLQQFSTRGDTTNDEDDASTIITTLDDLISNGGCGDPSVVGSESTENLKIPERLVQKLTTEDWNDLIQFICSTMEHSLQSNILQAIEKLRENNQLQEALPTSSELNSTIDNNRETSLDADTTNHFTTATKRTKHKHHNRHPRPLSMPSVSSTQLVDTGEAKHHRKHSNGHHSYVRNKHSNHHTREEDGGGPPTTLITKLNDESDTSKAIQPSNDGSNGGSNGGTNGGSNGGINSGLVRNKVRSSSNPNTQHRVHFTDGTGSRLSSNVWRSCSGSSLDDLELNNKHCKYLDGGGRRRGYLTLDQLKDLGLTLQHDSSKSTSERLSSFSMKCWHGDPHNNQVTSTSSALVSSRRHPPKRRHRKRSSSKSKHDSTNGTKPSQQFEQLCLLGPETSSTPLPLSSSSPSVTPQPDDTTPSPQDNEDAPSGDNSTASSSEDSITAADVKVEHLHQHSHHHFHHFIHHSISQPSGLCDSSNYNTDKPSVKYIVNTNDRTVNSR